MNEYKITDKMHSWQKTYPVWVSALSVIVLLIIWELICRAGIVSPLFLPSPTGILSALADMVAGGEIAASLAASMYRIILGFVLGSVIGLAVGLFTGTSALIDRIGSPIVNALYPIPKIALLPLFILWLGIGELSKVTIIALGVFFPVAMNTYSGVKNVDPLLIKVAVSFNATRWMTLKKVVLPAALPMICRAAPCSRNLASASGCRRNDCRTGRHRRADTALRRFDDYRPLNGRRNCAFAFRAGV